MTAKKMSNNVIFFKRVLGLVVIYSQMFMIESKSFPSVCFCGRSTSMISGLHHVNKISLTLKMVPWMTKISNSFKIVLSP